MTTTLLVTVTQHAFQDDTEVRIDIIELLQTHGYTSVRAELAGD